MRVAFISGLSDKKLGQKLAPLQHLPSVTRIDLYRRQPFTGEKVVWQGVPLGIRAKSFLGDIWRMAILLVNARHCDLIIGCHQRFHGVMAEIAGRVWRKPVIQMIIGSVDRAYSDRLSRWLLRRTSVCAVRGENSMRQLREQGFGGFAAVVANPFDLPNVTCSGDVTGFDLLAVGNYTPAKDYPWMLEVLSQVRDHQPQIKLAIAGGRGVEQHLHRLLRAHDLEPNVEFLGHLDEEQLDRAYAISKILLLTSCTEGLPMALIEGMSRGLPVVVTDVGENSWLVKDDVGGRVVQHGDTRAMADAVLALLDDPAELAWQGKLARARIEGLMESFSIEAIAGRWEELVEQAMTKRATTVSSTELAPGQDSRVSD